MNLKPNRPSKRLNVADRLTASAARFPDAIAVACNQRVSPTYPAESRGKSGCLYATITFAELDADATRIARGLAAWGVRPGTRLALLVRPGIEFVTLVFALLRAGVVMILVDPGLGRKNLVRCLNAVEPEGFVAVGVAQVARLALRHKFPRAKWNVTVGRRWFWGGLTLDELRARGESVANGSPTNSPVQHVGGAHPTQAADPAAMIFTSGSTGMPKGVLYTHRMFDTQVSEIQSKYDIEPGGVDLACFPLFALFNSAMGVTTVFPEMDFSRPASADPRKLLAAANDWQVTQAFASPAVWGVVGRHFVATGKRIPSLRQVFSCGAPVPAHVLRQTLEGVAEGAKMHTPYGATECLPVATIEAAEILSETVEKTDCGAGVCVGRKFESIDWRVIRITDKPIATIDEAEEMPTGEIGELIVRGSQASPSYVTCLEENGASKIADSRSGEEGRFPAPCSTLHPPFWHRMGDIGYLDGQGRFWYCGRKSHRVETVAGPLFTECVEAVFNTHPAVRRSALVGIGPRGKQTPVLVVECQAGTNAGNLIDELRCHARACQQASDIQHSLIHPGLPVDIRHNAKINREQLAAWATKQLSRRRASGPISHL